MCVFVEKIKYYIKNLVPGQSLHNCSILILVFSIKYTNHHLQLAKYITVK